MNLKRLTSLLLTLVMVVGLVPMAAFAEETEQPTGPTVGSYTKRAVNFDSSVAKIENGDFYVNSSTPSDGYVIAGFDWVDELETDKYIWRSFGDVNLTNNEMQDANGNKSYTYRPVYVAKRENGQFVSVDDDAQLFVVGADAHQTPEWIKIEEANIGTDSNPIKAFRISIVEPTGLKLVPSMRIHVRLALFVGGINNGNFSVETYTYNSYNNNTQEESIRYYASDATRPEPWGGIEAYIDINEAKQEKRYLVKRSRATGQITYVTTQDIDVSTLQISTTNNMPVEFAIESDRIGYVFTIDKTTATTEEIRITFKTNQGDDCYIYAPVIIIEEVQVIGEEVTVSNVEDFLFAYRTMAAGTIYLKPETYTFTEPFIHSNEAVNIVGIEENGEKPVFKSSGDAVIIVKGDTFMNGKIKNIVVDGENTKIGIKGAYVSDNKGISFDVVNTTITNCTTGVINPFDLTRLVDCTFEGNTVAVQTTKAPVSVEGSEFKGNTTAVYVGNDTSNDLLARPSIKNNNFIGNGKDVVADNNTAEVQLQQNFFGDTAESDFRAPVMEYANSSDKVTNVYYQPHYTTAERTVLDAALEGAQSKTEDGTTTYILPVDLTLNANSIFKNDIFGLIKDNEAVEINVRSADLSNTDTTVWLYNKATLSTTMDFTKTTTNIAAKDALEEGSSTVTNNIGDATLYQTINFAHSGALPGAARVTVDGAEDASAESAQLYLYHIDGDKLVLEEDAKVEVTVDTTAHKNYYSFTSDHCSEYIISTMIVEDTTGSDPAEKEPAEKEEPEDKEEDKSSSSSSSKKDKETATATPAPTAAPVVVKPAATPAANDFISAIEVEEKINNAAEAEVVFDVSKKDIVSVKAFELIEANPEKALVFETEEFKWTFEGKDITDAKAIEGTTFKPAIKLESPNKEEIKAAAGKVAEEFTHIYFEHHGKLPGKAKVEVFVGEAEAGATKHLYHFDPTAKAFEFIETLTITADGWAQFGITHCSDYILSDTLLDESLVIKTETETPAQPEEPVVDTPTEEPAQQKDGMGMMPIILIAVVVLAVVVVLIKKRKTE